MNELSHIQGFHSCKRRMQVKQGVMKKPLRASSGNSLDQGSYPIHLQLYRLFHCR